MAAMRSMRTHTVRLGSGKIRRGRAALAAGGVAAIAVAAIVATLALTSGGTPPASRGSASRGSASRETAARPALAVTSLAGYPGQPPSAGAPRLAVNAVAAGDGQRIAVGSAGGHPAIWRRDARGTWALVTSLRGLPARSTAAALTSVTYGPAGWLAVGVPGPIVLWSADGTTWRSAGGSIAADLGEVTVISATGGPRGYVILGKLAVPGGGCVGDIWWSRNLTSWTRARDADSTTGSSQTLAVAALANGFVSVGSHEGKPAAWITSNGTTWWTIVMPDPVNAQLNHIAVIGARVIATGGSDGKGARPTPAFVMSSSDGGASWRQEAFRLPQPGTVVTALAAGGRAFVAAGQYGTPGLQRVAVWELPAGADTWTPVHVSGITGPGAETAHEITALGAAGDAVTGIGPVAPTANDRAVIFTLRAR
jgi:hypothetical protein